MRFPARHVMILILLVCCLPADCQVLDAKRCDTSEHMPITKYTAYLRTSSRIELDSVLRSHTFVQAEDKPVLIFNYDPYYYWFRIIVRNTDDKPAPLMLLMAPFGLYDGRLFQKNNGSWHEIAHSGLRYRFKDRSYQFTHHVFPFAIPQYSTDTVYLSIDAPNVYKSVGFALLRPKVLKMFENKTYFVFGIIVGLLILFFILNVSLFFALRQKLHMWYALYIALLFLVVMKNDLLDQQFLGLDSERAFRLTPFMAIGAFAIATLMHVVQGFLKEEHFENIPLCRLTTILKVNVVVSAIIHGLVFGLASDYRAHLFAFSWAKISTMLCICMIIINCLYAALSGIKGAWLILSGSFVFMLGSLQRLFFASTLSFLFPPTTFHIGIIVETFVISIALVYLFWKEFAKQKQRAALALAEKNESAANFERELRAVETEVQEATLSHIAAELHDNIGQLLAVVHMQVEKEKIHHPENTFMLAPISETVTTAINQVRLLSHSLNTDFVKEGGLQKSIANEVQRLQGIDSLTIHFETDGKEPELSKDAKIVAFRIFQEAITNALRHSKCNSLLIVINGRDFLLRVVDDGKGFDKRSTLQSSDGLGLKTMMRRASLAGLHCDIKSRIDEGSRFTITCLANTASN